VIEIMTGDGQNPRNAAHAARYALLAGGRSCGAAAARGARLAHDEALAEFLCRVQAEIVDAANSLF
jgi:hypothetical protein